MTIHPYLRTPDRPPDPYSVAIGQPRVWRRFEVGECFGDAAWCYPWEPCAPTPWRCEWCWGEPEDDCHPAAEDCTP